MAKQKKPGKALAPNGKRKALAKTASRPEQQPDFHEVLAPSPQAWEPA